MSRPRPKNAMKKRLRWIGIIVFLGVVALLLFLPQGSRIRSATFWKRQTSPGALSASHAFLENNCAACHTPIKGVEAANCIACHANDEALLALQPTAFHAHIQSCRECHFEHQGVTRRLTWMDHAALVDIGLRELGKDRADREKIQARDQVLTWIRQSGSEGAAPEISHKERTLDCSSCHSNKDPHFKLFGQDCAQCHGTTKWTIAGFLHPSPRSTSCGECHQAPPSHFMEHFEMVSKRVAKQPDAKVNECYKCHLVDSWNDIKGVGWYKHH